MEARLKCVLLIDDDGINNFVHKTVLTGTGVAGNIETAETVQEALGLLEPGAGGCPTPDLIFLDLNMPGLTGWDFIDGYRKLQDRRRLNCVIVILTASANPDDGKRAGEISEVAEFRNKPLTSRMVEEIMQKHFVA